MKLLVDFFLMKKKAINNTEVQNFAHTLQPAKKNSLHTEKSLVKK